LVLFNIFRKEKRKITTWADSHSSPSARPNRTRARGPRERRGLGARQPAGPARPAQAGADSRGLWSKGPCSPETRSRGGADRGEATAADGVFAVAGGKVSGGCAQELQGEVTKAPQGRIRVPGGSGGAEPRAWQRWPEHGGGGACSSEGSAVAVERAPAGALVPRCEAKTEERGSGE
jgi:hypothetical protein